LLTAAFFRIQFGSALKTYGEDFGGKSEGRRYYVPEYTYTDNWDGVTYTR
jgi:hypothetical protein